MNDQLESDILKEVANQLSLAHDIMESKFITQPNRSVIAKLMVIAHGEPAQLYGTDKLLKLPTAAQREDRSSKLRKLLRAAFTKSLQRKHKVATDKEAALARQEKRFARQLGVGQTREKFYSSLEDDPVPQDLVAKWDNELRHTLSEHNTNIKSQLQLFLAYLNQHNEACSAHPMADNSDYVPLIKKFNICKSRSCTGFPLSLIGEIAESETPLINGLTKLIKILDSSYRLEDSFKFDQAAEKIRDNKSCNSPDNLASIYVAANAILKSYASVSYAPDDIMSKPFDDLDYKLLLNSDVGRKFAKKNDFWADDVQFVQELDSPEFTIVSYVYYVYHELSKKDNELTIDQCLELLKKDYEADETHGEYWRSLVHSHPELSHSGQTYDDIISHKASLDQVVESYLKANTTLDDEDLATKADIWGIRPTGKGEKKTLETDVPRANGDNRPAVLELINKAEYDKFAWIILTGTDYTAMVPGSEVSDENKAFCPICGGGKTIDPATLANYSLVRSHVEDGEKLFLGQSGIESDAQNIYPEDQEKKGEKHDLWPKCAHCYGTGFDEPWYWSACRKPEDSPPFIQLFMMLWGYLTHKGLKPEAYDGVLRTEPSNGKTSPRMAEVGGQHFPVPLPRRPHTYGVYGNEVERERAVESCTVIIKIKKLGDDPTKSQEGFISLMDEFKAILGTRELSAELDHRAYGNIPNLGIKVQYNIAAWKIEPVVDSDIADHGSKTVSGNKSDLKQFLAERNSKSGRAPSVAFLGDLHQLADLAYQFERYKRPTYAYPIWVFIDRAKKHDVPTAAIKQWNSVPYSDIIKHLCREVKGEKGNDYFIKHQNYFEGKLKRLADRAEMFNYDGASDISDRLTMYAKSADTLALVRNSGIFGAKKSDVKSGAAADRIMAIINVILKLKDPPSTILIDGIPQSFHPACDMLMAMGRPDIAESVYDISDEKLIKMMSEDDKISSQRLKQIQLIYSRLMADERLLDVMDRFDEYDFSRISKHYRKAFPQYGIVNHSMDSLNSLRDDGDLRTNQVKLIRSAYRQLEQKCSESETYRNAFSKLKGGYEKVLSDLDAYITTAEVRLKPDYQAKKIRAHQRQLSLVHDTPKKTIGDAEFEDEYIKYGTTILIHGGDKSRKNVEYLIVNRLIKLIHYLSSQDNMVQLGTWWNPHKLGTSVRNLIPLMEWCLLRGRGLKVALDGLFLPGVGEEVDTQSLVKTQEALDYWKDNPFALFSLISQYMKTMKK